MGMQELTLETLGEVDHGKIAAAFNLLLQRVMLDCFDRPGDDKARSVELRLLVSPMADPNTGAFDGCQVQFKLKSSVPPLQSKLLSMDADKRGRLKFVPAEEEAEQEH